LSRENRPTIRDFTIAIAATVLAIAFRGLLDPILGEYQPLGILFAAIAVSIWQAGLLPSVVAAVLGYVASNILFVPPRGRFALEHGHDWVALAAYVVAAVLILVVGESMRRSRRAERERAGELQALLDILPVGVLLGDESCERITGNPAAYAMFGQKDVTGSKAFEQLRPYFQRALEGETVRHEEEVTFRGRGPRWISAVCTRTLDASGTWVAVVTDVDERRRAEQSLRDADRKKNEFLAVLAHELRGPLAPIRNAARFLQGAGRTERELQVARGIIDRQVDQLVRLVDDLLDMSRITQGRIQIRSTRIELGPVVHLAVEESRPIIGSRGHVLTVSLPSEPIWLDADPARVAQIITNLLQNAAKYTDPGGRVWLSVQRDGDQVLLSVRDDGVGIPKESLETIFSMFAQVPSDRVRSEGGLGIGLALVRGLVELHGGAVEARSDGPGRGSEFIVRLPSAASCQAPAGGGPAATRSDERHRILVVDDDQDSADILRMLLALHGHEIRIAHDGLEAVREADAFRPEMVRLDIGLPRRDGHQVAREIRRRAWGSGTVLVALTGWGQEEDRPRALEAGFDHYLTKPIDPTAVASLVRSLGDRAPSRETEDVV
jgi:signal transduction histidine kinase/CheY-like chemotaxis protein